MSYPGSPAIAQTLMRAQDRIALCEANPDEREALIAALGRDGRLSIVGTDGYVALNAYLPPKERRGVVLIDPPFEAPDEASGIVRGSRAGAAQMADRDLRRLAADPRRSSRRPLSQCGRRARRAKHPAARTRRWPRADRRAWPGAARRTRGFSSSIRRIRFSTKRGRCCRGSRKLLARDGGGRQLCAWLTEAEVSALAHGLARAASFGLCANYCADCERR